MSQTIQNSLQANHFFQPLTPKSHAGETTYQHVAAMAGGFSISMTTDEGDIVSITGNSMQGYYLGGKNPSGRNISPGKSHGASFLEENTSIHVVGDLNEKELAQIKKLVKDLRHIAEDFFRGDTLGATRKALQIGDLGPVASLSATFAYSASYARSVTTAGIATPSPSLRDMVPDIEESVMTDPLPPNSSLLESQWKQILAYLSQEKSRMVEQSDMVEKQPPGKDHASDMLERATSLISKHPRLSPHVPSLARHAIYSAAPATDTGAASARHLFNSFIDAFRHWTMES